MAENNMAAMREALKVANETADELLKWIWNHYQELNCMGSRLKRAVEAAHAALALPPRQCDVGTAAEQYQRFLKYCKKNTGGCDRADRYANPCAYCLSQWAQMPYESKEKKNEHW